MRVSSCFRRILALNDGFAVLPGDGVLTQPPLFLQRLADGLAERFQLPLPFRRWRGFSFGVHRLASSSRS